MAAFIKRRTTSLANLIVTAFIKPHANTNSALLKKYHDTDIARINLHLACQEAYDDHASHVDTVRNIETLIHQEDDPENQHPNLLWLKRTSEQRLRSSEDYWDSRISLPDRFLGSHIQWLDAQKQMDEAKLSIRMVVKSCLIVGLIWALVVNPVIWGGFGFDGYVLRL